MGPGYGVGWIYSTPFILYYYFTTCFLGYQELCSFLVTNTTKLRSKLPSLKRPDPEPLTEEDLLFFDNTDSSELDPSEVRDYLQEVGLLDSNDDKHNN